MDWPSVLCSEEGLNEDGRYSIEELNECMIVWMPARLHHRRINLAGMRLGDIFNIKVKNVELTMNDKGDVINVLRNVRIEGSMFEVLSSVFKVLSPFHLH